MRIASAVVGMAFVGMLFGGPGYRAKHAIDRAAARGSAAPSRVAATAARSIAPRAPRPLVVAPHERSNLDRYIHLGQAACEAELVARGIRFRRAESADGVRAPVRLHGTLGRVAIHSLLPASARAISASEIFDCRLVLTLDDFAGYLARRGVTAIVFMSAYRPPSDYGCTKKYLGEQHCAALAVDVAALRRTNGDWLSIERDFHGRVGLDTCGPGSKPVVDGPAARALWEIACDAAGQYFNVVLTPNYDRAHANHFHLELTRHPWVLVR